LAPSARPAKIRLVDRQNLIQPATLDAFKRLDCEAEIIVADVLGWLESRPIEAGAVMIANLFLHHLDEAELRDLFRLVAASADLFAACEPRRAGLALFGSRLLGLIGCNEVTRHDAVVSVAAGFSGMELSALWPDPARWEMQEEAAGLFSHLFMASRQVRD
jgi:hypothetical protein